jgi:hypothetical protein
MGLPEIKILGFGSAETRPIHASCSTSTRPLMPMSIQAIRTAGVSMEKYILGWKKRFLRMARSCASFSASTVRRFSSRK